MARPLIRVLLIEDEESDYLLTRRMLRSCPNQDFDVQWAGSWQAGIEGIRRCNHDVCLLDFRIGGGDGLELLKEANSVRCKAPVILLTGLDDYRLDVEASELGAADFLSKNKITPELLERSIRYAIAHARTLDDLRRREKELSALELRFRSVVQSANDAIVLANANGNIVLWNKAAEAVFGYAEEEMLNLPIEALFQATYRRAQTAGFERFRVTGRSNLIGKTVQLDGLRKDGTVFPVELSLAAWSTDGETMFTAIFRDITERRIQSDFIIALSHQLRVLLQPVMGFTNLLLKNRRGNLADQDLNFLRRILDNAQRQLRIIDELQKPSTENEDHLRLSA
jgi:two-component system, LuxR family, sensor kinase FixL